MLFEEFMEPCCRIVKYTESDGEGGKKTTTDDGPEFMAAIVLNSSNEGTVASSERMIRTYTITAPIGTKLGYFEHIKRLSDDQVFRVTSSPRDAETPARASFQFEQVQAEAIHE